MVWVLSRGGDRNNWNNDFTNFFRGGWIIHYRNTHGFILFKNTIIQYRNTYCLLRVPAPGANPLGLGTQKTRAQISPGRSSSLKFPAKADLISRSGQLEVPHIGYVYSEISVIYASPGSDLSE